MNKRLTERDIGDIVMMRGLGYSQSEIAQYVGVSQAAVQYQLRKIRKRAERNGRDNTLLALLLGAGIGLGVGLSAVLLAEALKNK